MWDGLYGARVHIWIFFSYASKNIVFCEFMQPGIVFVESLKHLIAIIIVVSLVYPRSISEEMRYPHLCATLSQVFLSPLTCHPANTFP